MSRREPISFPFRQWGAWKRFHANVDRSAGPDGCWPFGKGERNYGAFNVNGKNYNAHRVAFFLTRRKWALSMFICHHCDYPPCCNPKHLFAGTASDNAWDFHVKRDILKEAGLSVDLMWAPPNHPIRAALTGYSMEYRAWHKGSGFMHWPNGGLKAIQDRFLQAAALFDTSHRMKGQK